jgi:hypothetical protein
LPHLECAGTAHFRVSQLRVTPVSADGSWTVRVTGSAESGLSATAEFWIVLLVGVGFSGLLFGFVRVLGRSRGASAAPERRAFSKPSPSMGLCGSRSRAQRLPVCGGLAGLRDRYRRAASVHVAVVE